MMDNARRIFYLFSFIFLLRMQAEMARAASWIESAELHWPVRWAAAWLNQTTIPILYALSLAAMLSAAVWPRARTARVAAALAWPAVAGIAFAFGMVYHGDFGWMMASLLFIFPWHARESAFNQAVTATRAYCISIYAIAGTWKLVYILDGLDAGGWGELSGVVPMQAAFGLATGGKNSFLWLDFFSAHPFLSGIAWLVVVGFETGMALWLVFPRWNGFWGACVLLLHFAGSALTGANFRGQIYLGVFLFLVLPSLQRQPVSDRAERGADLTRLLFIFAFCVLLRAGVWNELSASLVEKCLGNWLGEGDFLAFYFLSLGSLLAAALFPRLLGLRLPAVLAFAACLVCIRAMGLGHSLDYCWLFLLGALGLRREQPVASPYLALCQKFLLGFVALLGIARLLAFAGNWENFARLPIEFFGVFSLASQQAGYLLAPAELGAVFFLLRGRFSPEKAGKYLFLVFILRGSLQERTPESFLLAAIFVFFLAPMARLAGDGEFSRVKDVTNSRALLAGIKNRSIGFREANGRIFRMRVPFGLGALAVYAVLPIPKHVFNYFLGLRG
jgi:hypothetical protein